ncbi:MAG: MoxR-like ATPase [Mariniblastus sp.]|jgi:MoxR-like ATPase
MNNPGSSTNEHVEFDCPQCSMRLKVSAAIAGQSAKCPSCSGIAKVPSGQLDPLEKPPQIQPQAAPTVEVVTSQIAETPVESAAQMVGAETPTRKLYRRITDEVAKVFVGQDELVQGTMVALFSGGHVLIESVPGLGKTLFVRTLGQILGCEFGRIQFTADLMPSDITGAPIFNMKTQEFEFRAGPVFTQLLLADEINRSPAKTHAALLEIMQEKHVTVDGKTHELTLPFLTVATQNPIESEGTYNLPEAQLDRFMFKLSAGYPSEDQEAEILMMHGGQADLNKQLENDIQQVTTPEEIMSVTRANGEVRIDPLLLRYINKIVRLTREWPQFYMGASPRAGISLMQGARTLAAFYGRDYAVPDDVVQIALPALRHRVQLTAEAEVEGQSVDQLLNDLIRTIEVPRLK